MKLQSAFVRGCSTQCCSTQENSSAGMDKRPHLKKGFLKMGRKKFYEWKTNYATYTMYPFIS